MRSRNRAVIKILAVKSGDATQGIQKEKHLSSTVKGFAVKLALNYSEPYTVTCVISPVVYDPKDNPRKRIKRIHIKSSYDSSTPIGVTIMKLTHADGFTDLQMDLAFWILLNQKKKSSILFFFFFLGK